MDIMRILLAILVASVIVAAQELRVLPDAPTPQPQPAARRGVGFYDRNVTIPTSQVLHSKYFWGTFGGDFLLSSFDAGMSHEGYAHHRCIEGGEGLPAHASRWQLYEHNLPENAAVGVLAFIWLKVKWGPKWIPPLFLTEPAIMHIRAGMRWEENCW